MAKPSVRVKWHGKEFMKTLQSEEEKRLQRAGAFLANEVKKKLSQKYPPASNPGEYPHLRTGELRNSITWEVENLVCRVGTNKHYAKYLIKDLDRDFLDNTLHENRRVIARMLVGKKIT